MKLNLPTTLTSPKISSLLLLTLLNLLKSEAGEAFRNCLKYQFNDVNSYDRLLNYPFPSGELGVSPSYNLWLCCDSNSCQASYTSCTSLFICVRIGGKITCHYSSYGNSGKCQGIIGNEPITVNAVDRQDDNTCLIPNITHAVDSLTNNCLKTLTPVGLDKDYAFYEIRPYKFDPCPASARGFLSSCSWDNQGMNCKGPYLANCFLQFPLTWSELLTLNQTTNLPTADDHLIEKIAIPVGTVSGTSLIAGLTYYYCKNKKKKRKSLVLQETENSQAILNNLKEETEAIELDELTDKELSKIKEVVETHKVEVEEVSEENNELTTLTPPRSPQPNQSLSPQTISQTLSTKQILINELKEKLVGQEQLWNDYLDASQLVAISPNSRVAINQLHKLQTELLQILTSAEIGLLLEANHHYADQNEYTEAIEVTRSPQIIRYGSPQQWN